MSELDDSDDEEYVLKGMTRESTDGTEENEKSIESLLEETEDEDTDKVCNNASKSRKSNTKRAY